MEGSTTALFYGLNALIRLLTDHLLGYRLCHLSKSWESRGKNVLFLLSSQSTRPYKVSKSCLACYQGPRFNFKTVCLSTSLGSTSSTEAKDTETLGVEKVLQALTKI